MRVAVVSLGCAKNTVDAEVMAGLLREAGHEIAAGVEEAEAVVVNTCGFLEQARRESIDAILAAAGPEPGARRLIVAGCLVTGHREELTEALPEVEAFLGPAEIELLPAVLAGRPPPRQACRPGCQVLARPSPRILSTPPGTAYLKIADGCDNRCAYCLIPSIRGPFRSRPAAALIEEAGALAAGGVRELALVAQDTTRYGTDLAGGPDLAGLVRGLARVEGVAWIRILYAHPTGLNTALLDLFETEPHLAPYLDVPLQHADPEVLAAMGRPADPEPTRAWLADLRRRRPEAALRTTMIVGHPGESRAAFQRLLAFMEEVRFDHLGVFAFSPEPGTRSAALPGRPDRRTAERRWHRVMELQARISAERLEGRVGRPVEVLLQGRDERGLWGRTAQQAPEVDGVALVLEAETGGVHGSPGSLQTGRIVGLKSDYDVIVARDEGGNR